MITVYFLSVICIIQLSVYPISALHTLDRIIRVQLYIFIYCNG